MVQHTFPHIKVVVSPSNKISDHFDNKQMFPPNNTVNHLLNKNKVNSILEKNVFEKKQTRIFAFSSIVSTIRTKQSLSRSSIPKNLDWKYYEYSSATDILSSIESCTISLLFDILACIDLSVCFFLSSFSPFTILVRFC